jgi:hypothetical protein
MLFVPCSFSQRFVETPDIVAAVIAGSLECRNDRFGGPVAETPLAQAPTEYHRLRTCALPAPKGPHVNHHAQHHQHGHLHRFATLIALALALIALAAGLLGCVNIQQDQLPRAWRQDETREVVDWRDYDMSGLMEGDSWFTTTGSRHAGEIKGYGAGPAVFDATGGYFELAVISRREGVPVQQRVRVYFDERTPVYLVDTQSVAVQNERLSTTVLNGISKGEGYNVTRGKDVLDIPFYVNGGRLYATRVNVITDQRVEVP